VLSTDVFYLYSSSSSCCCCCCCCYYRKISWEFRLQFLLRYVKCRRSGICAGL